MALPTSNPTHLPDPQPQDIEWQLTRHPSSVGRARRLLRAQAAAWQVPDEAAQTAVLLLSELVTNAYRHARVPAGRQIHARCELTPGALRIEVSDANNTLPSAPAADADPYAESGRGLALVEMLAANWGVERRTYNIGKTVWCEIALS
ncbi:ATP-binding protein [Streptomyces sp. NA04227]|uniref:ATP-binding protein n=1 Tax=Streptomyces sp. NA04227 TaxID=2742136 RepID=UPI00159280BE|nr:ATP-binding protein [Streptomyces sp. NA04227]QKW08740.1 ATP-binding protein [Streptomyces sp. NA04227]